MIERMTKTVEVSGNEIELKIQVDYDLCNSGIGHYEYWGQKCFDKGEDYVEINEIKFDESPFSKQEIAEINDYLEDRKEQIIEDICDSLQRDKEYAQECRAEREIEMQREYNL